MKEQETRNKQRLLEQRLIAIGLLAICAVLFMVCAAGPEPEDKDVTAAVMLAPLALWMLFSKEILIY